MGYNSIATFGGMAFALSDVRPSRKPSTLKTNFGKTFVSKQIPMRDAVDIVLHVVGVIDGRSQTAGQSQITAIENDRTALIALEDGDKHAWADGRHSGDFVIITGSLAWPDDADIDPNSPRRFEMDIEEWQ